MNLSSMSKQFAAEILLFLAENEEFDSVESLLDNEISSEEVRNLLREVSSGLMQEALDDLKKKKSGRKNDPYISKQAKVILSHLTPHEENSLLEIFGVSEKS
ncbi:MAG: hypothetical protein COS89_09365 [Deltaproteobacteria bacterium CG07_land_8_20_14_0_80_38_7]|nr:MAG: hypothetical protein COS89_09365 [Deltaproteobacteria bacterium CG07_land_8_20_14_0_80_38_7]